jgi:hypothetical protein
MPGLGILLSLEKLVLFCSEFKAILRRLGHEPDRLGDWLRLDRWSVRQSGGFQSSAGCTTSFGLAIFTQLISNISKVCEYAIKVCLHFNPK